MTLDARRLWPAAETGAVFVLYVFTAKVGLMLDAVSGFATVVWPPTGLALTALLLCGSRFWPVVFAAAWVANVWAGAGPVVALGIATGNTLEGVLGGYVMRRVAGFCGTFDSVRLVLGLIVGAAITSTLVSSTVGVLTLSLAGITRSAAGAVETWHTWWVGDVLGDLVVAPLLLAWARPGDAFEWSVARALEAGALFALLAIVACVVFLHPVTGMISIEPPYILFPLFVWAGLRFELRGATAATAFTSVVAVCGTAHALGPFAVPGAGRNLLALQVFLGCAAATPLVVAGATMDRMRAIRAQEALLATVSHDLKNPLDAIRMSGAALAGAMPVEPVRRHQGIVTRSVDRMLRLIADLLAASAIDRGALGLDRAPHDTRALLDESVDLMRPIAAAKNVTLEVRAGPSPEIECDGHRVLQVLSNLVGNAIKFSPHKSTVTIQTQLLPRAVRVAVSDQGPGIERADARRIFEKYWHGKASAGGGTGLGLFIAKGIVEAHGGRIWVETAVGVGSTFFFTLPAR